MIKIIYANNLTFEYTVFVFVNSDQHPHSPEYPKIPLSFARYI